MDKEKQKRAVALKYIEDKMQAPLITAIGQGFQAEKIIALAKENKVPLQQDAYLVETLSKLQIGQEIPSDLYEVVAQLLAFVMHADEALK